MWYRNEKYCLRNIALQIYLLKTGYYWYSQCIIVHKCAINHKARENVIFFSLNISAHQ